MMDLVNAMQMVIDLVSWVVVGACATAVLALVRVFSKVVFALVEDWKAEREIRRAVKAKKNGE